MTLPAELLTILVCPKCKGPLEYRQRPAESLVCHADRLVYAVQDGIPVMLIDEAEPLADGDIQREVQGDLRGGSPQG